MNGGRKRRAIAMLAAALVLALSAMAPAQETAVETWQGETTAKIRVRQAPSLHGAVLTTLDRGSQVTVTARENEWVQITYAGEHFSITAWAHSDYVRRLPTPPEPDTIASGEHPEPAAAQPQPTTDDTRTDNAGQQTAPTTGELTAGSPEVAEPMIEKGALQPPPQSSTADAGAANPAAAEAAAALEPTPAAAPAGSEPGSPSTSEEPVAQAVSNLVAAIAPHHATSPAAETAAPEPEPAPAPKPILPPAPDNRPSVAHQDRDAADPASSGAGLADPPTLPFFAGSVIFLTLLGLLLSLRARGLERHLQQLTFDVDADSGATIPPSGPQVPHTKAAEAPVADTPAADSLSRQPDSHTPDPSTEAASPVTNASEEDEAESTEAEWQPPGGDQPGAAAEINSPPVGAPAGGDAESGEAEHQPTADEQPIPAIPVIREKRQYYRHKRLIEVDFSSGGKFYRGFIYDISKGGAYIESRHVLANGQNLILTYPAPNEKGHIKCSATVLRVEATGFAVQFTGTGK